MLEVLGQELYLTAPVVAEGRIVRDVGPVDRGLKNPLPARILRSSSDHVTIRIDFKLILSYIIVLGANKRSLVTIALPLVVLGCGTHRRQVESVLAVGRATVRRLI